MSCKYWHFHLRVLEEVNEVLGGRDYVSAEDLDKLQYMDQVSQHRQPFFFLSLICHNKNYKMEFGYNIVSYNNIINYLPDGI